ncbi:MAG: hypothetical protein AAF334_07780 [Pseudomonadota bacterium]
MKTVNAIAAVMLVALMTACAGTASSPSAPPPDSPGTRLTPAEVISIFIGRPWRSEKGEFLFGEDGLYRYRSATTTTEWGPWPYRLTDQGALVGPSATYTFFRLGGAYRYYNSETDAFYLAFPENG